MRVEVSRIADSCGYGVPLMAHEGQRPHAPLWAQKKLRTGGEQGDRGVRPRPKRASASTGCPRSTRTEHAVPKRPDAKVVWSSDDGDRRKARDAATRPRLARRGGRVKVRRETAGRRGKAVTTISGVPLDDAGLRELAGRLKKRCGVGGSAKDGVIELQGDHRDVVVELLRGDGYDVVLAGG